MTLPSCAVYSASSAASAWTRRPCGRSTRLSGGRPWRQAPAMTTAWPRCGSGCWRRRATAETKNPTAAEPGGVKGIRLEQTDRRLDDRCRADVLDLCGSNTENPAPAHRAGQVLGGTTESR